MQGRLYVFTLWHTSASRPASSASRDEVGPYERGDYPGNMSAHPRIKYGAGSSAYILRQSLLLQDGRDPMEAYCVKCRSKREMRGTQAIAMKNGRPTTQGVCPVCSTKMFRIDKVA